MGILNIIVLLTFAVCIISGAARGFLRILFSVLTLVVCLFVASHFSTQAETFLKENTNLYQIMNSSVYSTMSADSEEESQQIEEETETQTQTLSEVLLGGLSSDESLPETLVEGINQTVTSIRDTVVTGIANSVTNSLFSMLVWVGLFFITWLVMKLLYAIFSVGLHNRAIGGVNRILGAVTGAAEALLIVWLILSVVTFGQDESSAMVSSVTSQPFLKILYSTDPFLKTSLM
ncbi:MAG: CvpA family protein [Lachnospiraceae bacterium]